MKYLQVTTAILLMGVLVAVAQVGPQNFPNGGNVYYQNTPKPVQTNQFSLYGYISGFFGIRSTSDLPKPTPNITFNFGHQFPPKGSNTNKSKSYSYGDKSDFQYGVFPSKKMGPRPKHRGLAQILYDGENPICTAVQLSRLLLLTAANCVYWKDLDKLRARIIVKQNGVHTTMIVKVIYLAVHPKYESNRHNNNFAMLILNTMIYPSVSVDAYIPVDRKYTTDDILKNKTDTLVDQMFHYQNFNEGIFIAEIWRGLTKNFGVCDELGEVADWYCAVKGSGRANYTQADIGTPLYYYNNNLEKILLGIYTGRRSNVESKGHVFESLYPALDFINHYYMRYRKY